jgi:LysM repeat protein
MSIFIGAQKISSQNIQSSTVYTVKNGDRLWDIAASVQSNEDIRQVIRTIRLNNDIASNEYIYPGQKLIIPYQMNN